MSLLFGMRSSFFVVVCRDSIYVAGEMLQPSCEKFLEMLCESVMHPSFVAEDLEFQKNSMRFEREDWEKNPDKLIEEVLFRQAFPNHPLGWPAVPTVETVDKINAERLRRYHEEVVVGQNLVVAG